MDTIATSCRSALKSLEEKKGQLYGKDCIAGNIVLQMNKFRYKDGKGDPKGFTTFLDDKKLPRGILPRYRGNRLHIFFHICGKLMEHHPLFLEFLTTGNCKCGGLQAALLSDFSNNNAKMEMQVLGLIGKLLSGPWMKMFYISADKQINHIEGIAVIRNVVIDLKESCKNPLGILDRDNDYFGNPLDKADTTLKVLQQCSSSDNCSVAISEMIGVCLNATIIVLERQYKRYFEMDLTAELFEEAKTARTHNMDAEEVMGMFSALKKRAPNATLAFLSARMRAKKNRTIEYLDELDSENREKLMKWVKTYARKRRDFTRIQDAQIR